MEVTIITEEPTITPDQFRMFYRAQYLKRKTDDLDKYTEQKKRYNAKVYAKKKAELALTQVPKPKKTPEELKQSRKVAQAKSYAKRTAEFKRLTNEETPPI
jgi:hypothetical protein